MVLICVKLNYGAFENYPLTMELSEPVEIKDIIEYAHDGNINEDFNEETGEPIINVQDIVITVNYILGNLERQS